MTKKQLEDYGFIKIREAQKDAGFLNIYPWKEVMCGGWVNYAYVVDGSIGGYTEIIDQRGAEMKLKMGTSRDIRRGKDTFLMKGPKRQGRLQKTVES